MRTRTAGGLVSEATPPVWVPGRARQALRPLGSGEPAAEPARRETFWRLWWRGWTSWAAAFVHGGGTR